MLVSLYSCGNVACIYKSISIEDVVVRSILDGIGSGEELLAISNCSLILLLLVRAVESDTVERTIVRILLYTSLREGKSLVVLLENVCCRSIVEEDIVLKRSGIANLVVVVHSRLKLVVRRIHVTSGSIYWIVGLNSAELLEHSNSTLWIYLLVNTSILNVSCWVLRSLLCSHLIVRSSHTAIVLCRSDIATKNITSCTCLAYLHCLIGINLSLLEVLCCKECTSKTSKSLSILLVELHKRLNWGLSCNNVALSVYYYLCNGINLRLNVLCH